MKMSALLFIAIFAFSGCTVYRSPERKEFESESSTFRVQNLKQVSCTTSSLRSQAEAGRLVTIQPSPASDGTLEDLYLYEYIIQNQSYFESDNLKGDFCAFELR